ncbi:hypothetical protein [Alkaliphilus hydrothermalis]|uniref:Uncharacterized protein n=1 Tax=Alkaliphilus hydrothermalis TaxID=1482730 RepID=A0ABS2NS08_9FIRM|nr:hypothetical protein [Alkaliphilus hydrothermalis]MBM7615730.1 hypothetical protein [Alkaliphilus hydrothermalis]
MCDSNLTLQEWHKKQAINNFNETWNFIDKKDRTKEDDAMMIHTAHASCFHWRQVGTPLEFARGEWQISRVYALVGMAEGALYHGKLSLELCQSNNIGDFDLAFGYEAVARAYMIMNDPQSMQEYVELATRAAEDIPEIENKEYFLSELKSVVL